MLFQTVVCLLFLVRNIQSEVTGGNPIEQNVKQGDNNASQNDQLSKLSNQYDDFTLHIRNVPPVKHGETVFKEMCEKNGGISSYTEAMQAITNIRSCFASIISYAELPKKIKNSRRNGELDVVFKEYCLKTDDMKGCINKFLVEVEPCLAENQKSSKYAAQNITEAIMNFVCENEGDHIALFISEKGPDCILSKQDGIKRCLQENLPDNKTNEMFENMNATNGDNFNFTSEPERGFSLSFELEQCRTAFQIRKCIVDELTTCSGSTPANVVDSVFNIIHNSTTCSKFNMKEIDPNYNGGSSLFTSVFAVIIPAFTVLLVRTFNS